MKSCNSFYRFWTERFLDAFRRYQLPHMYWCSSSFTPHTHTRLHGIRSIYYYQLRHITPTNWDHTHIRAAEKFSFRQHIIFQMPRIWRIWLMKCGGRKKRENLSRSILLSRRCRAMLVYIFIWYLICGPFPVRLFTLFSFVDGAFVPWLHSKWMDQASSNPKAFLFSRSKFQNTIRKLNVQANLFSTENTFFSDILISNSVRRKQFIILLSRFKYVWMSEFIGWAEFKNKNNKKKISEKEKWWLKMRFIRM